MSGVPGTDRQRIQIRPPLCNRVLRSKELSKQPVPRKFPTEFQRHTLWSALTGIAIVVIGALVVGFIVLLGNVLTYLQPVLVPLAVAGILAYLLNPLVEKLEQKGLSRLRAIIYVFTLTAALCSLGISVVIPKVVEQTGQLLEKREELASEVVHDLRATPWLRPLVNQALADNVEEASAQADEEQASPPLKEYDAWLKGFPEWAPGKNSPEFDLQRLKKTKLWQWGEDNIAEIASTAFQWLRGGAGKVLGFFGYALGFLLVPVYLFFFLKETATIKRRWSHFVPLKESNLKREVIETLSAMNEYLIAFFRGQVVVSIIDGVLTGLLLWMIGLPYAFVIGLALAILGVMPFIGFLMTLIPALIIAAATWGDWQHPAMVFAIFFVVQQIDGLFIQPKIIGDKVGLHPMTIIFSIFFWSLILGGFLGALLAVPLTASVKVLFTRYIWDPASLDDVTDPPPCEETEPA